MEGDRKDGNERDTGNNTRDTHRDDALPLDSLKKGEGFEKRDDDFPPRRNR
jgi:hypothetical protein